VEAFDAECVKLKKAAAAMQNTVVALDHRNNKWKAAPVGRLKH
jgi:hypothetical protein